MFSTFTVAFESPYWVGILERTDEDGFWIGRHIFGAEPSNAELLEFAIRDFAWMRMTLVDSLNTETKPDLRPNLKRAMREAKKTQRSGISSYTHEALQEQFQLLRKERKSLSKEQKEKLLEERFAQRTLKSKKKHRGH